MHQAIDADQPRVSPQVCSQKNHKCTKNAFKYAKALKYTLKFTLKYAKALKYTLKYTLKYAINYSLKCTKIHSSMQKL